MGFSEKAIREREGLVEAYLEDQDPYYHGLDPATLSERKSGRKKRKPKVAPRWPYGDPA